MSISLTTPVRFEGQTGIIVGHCFKNGDLYDIRLRNGEICLYVRPDKLRVTGEPLPKDAIIKLDGGAQ